MKFKNLPLNRIIALCVLASAFMYALFYFNYFETPSGDYIGNIRGPVLEYMRGEFPGTSFKFLPLYPLILSLLVRLNPIQSFDQIYLTALILNIFLLAPYLVLVQQIYRRFLGEKTAWLAMVFLGANIYTVYTAINSELEMLLTLLIVLSLYLTLRDSKFSYVTAFMTSVTKWDSVFIIPAVMFRDFFYRKRRFLALLLGSTATIGVAGWLVLSLVKTMGNPYISEIAHRGPNIYRFIIDCFLVSSGFIPWMATQGYFSKSLLVKASLLGLIILPALVVVTGMIWGVILIIKKEKKDFAPIFVFFAGFLLIHLIYQNTKDRYVLPVLWILILFLFYGCAYGLFPWIMRIYGRFSLKSKAWWSYLLLAAAAGFFLLSIGAIAAVNTPLHVMFALLFFMLSATVILNGPPRRITLHRTTAILLCGVITNLLVFYGVHVMDHHGLARVEFKKVALWYREHARPHDKMLIAETNVPEYYSGFGNGKFIISYAIKGNTLKELIPELRNKGVTYVFVDDFYIRRLAYNDPNAIDRKAWIFKEIRDMGEKTGHFRLIKTFHTRGGITSYLYRFIP